ncbi:MAG: AbrB/MazE/SpoVT family DNA-binding domain-containing protein [Oscillospiraceae bacterium]|nr:AbrB/MazE/SpoVT family DNA-binding domain-containing protein [Oscillospiraceae bacterium]
MLSENVQKREQKRVTITSKRQFTIPQKFYSELGFDREALCIKTDGMLIIRPSSGDNGGEFAEQILAELIDEGFSGYELLDEFRKRRSMVRPAVENMMKAAKKAAEGTGEYYTYEDVFGRTDD